MPVTCKQDGCLIAQDGVCLITGNAAPCEHAVGTLEEQIAEQVSRSIVSAPLPIVQSVPAIELHAGVELGMADVADLMGEMPGLIIGVLGLSDAGKTSFLNALYLICSCGEANRHGYAFAGSLTLPGFEDRARASRNWVPNGIPPRMSVRTQIADGRSAGFMHVDLHRKEQSRRVRILLSDLPGEWTSDLIDNSRHADRFRFLDRADVIFLMVEASRLANSETRHVEMHSQKMLLDRLVTIAKPGTPMKVIATKCDEVNMQTPRGLGALVTYANALGFPAEEHLIASISKLDSVPSGTGVMEAIAWAVERSHRPIADDIRSVTPDRFFGWKPVSEGEMP